jgi:hypothetical protein
MSGWAALAIALVSIVGGLVAVRSVARLADPLPHYRVPAISVLDGGGRCFPGGFRAASLHASTGAQLVVRRDALVVGPRGRLARLVLPAWRFPARAVTDLEAVVAWPRRDGVRIWVDQHALVFFARGGSGPVLDAALALGYPVHREPTRVSMFDPASDVADG